MLNCIYTALNLKLQKKYPAYTLLELLVVMSILGILGTMSFSAFGSLQNTVKMNEYVLTIEQDVRSVQRAAMLLQRTPGERWLYGLGIDFGDMKDSGDYTVFKWCSPFDDYGNILTKSNLPAYNPSKILGLGTGHGTDKNGEMPMDRILRGSCGTDVSSSLSILSGYDKTTRTPISTINRTAIDTKVPRYVIFESVSGRTFFYDELGGLLNYTAEGKMVDDPGSFVITIIPDANVNTRIITISNLSGKISTLSVQ